jgi:hypothetical protein
MEMKIVHGDEVPCVTNTGEGVRSGQVGKQFLLFGDPASPGNFKFGLFRQYGDFESPRHRHNFCQFRVQIEGECDFDVPGKKNTDGFEAVWEQACGRKLVYATPQYSRPVLMNPKGYRWMPLEGSVGVEEKALGTYSDCKIRCASYRLHPGATFNAAGRGIYLVLSGRGLIEGQTFRQYTAVYLDTGESTRFKATETSEILLLGMPDVAHMMQHRAAEVPSDAAV